MATTTAPIPDFAATDAIQDWLAGRGLPPREHLVDAGYVTAAHLIRSRRDHDCELLRPVAAERGWQARAGQGYAAAQFVIDWEAERATCPQGKPSVAWTLADDADGHPVVIIQERGQDAGAELVTERAAWADDRGADAGLLPSFHRISAVPQEGATDGGCHGTPRVK